MKKLLIALLALGSMSAFAELPDEWCTKVNSLEYKSDSIQINERVSINAKYFSDHYNVSAEDALRLEVQAVKAAELAVTSGKKLCISKSTRNAVYSVGVKP